MKIVKNYTGNRETQRVRELRFQNQCADVENLEQKGTYDVMYRKVKNTTWDGRCTSFHSGEISSKDGLIVKNKMSL